MNQQTSPISAPPIPEKYMPIQAKLGITMALVFIVLLLAEYLIFTQAASDQLKAAEVENEQQVQVLSRFVDGIYRETVYQMNAITMRDDLHLALQISSSEPGLQNQSNLSLRQNLVERLFSVDTINWVYVWDGEGNRRVVWKRVETAPPLAVSYDMAGHAPESGWVSAMKLSDGLAFVRRIRAFEGYEEVGRIAMIYDTGSLLDFLESLAQEFPGRELALYDESGTLLTSTSGMDDIYDEGIKAEAVSPLSAWTLISVLDRNQITQGSRDLVQRLMLGTMIGLFAAGLLFSLVSRRITKSLREMARVIQAEDLSYQTRFKVTTRDEVRLLAETLNGLLARTQQLVHRILRDELRYRDAQLRVLQGQLNPHLLNNVLDCINWLALDGKAEEVRQVTVAFSQLMQKLRRRERICTVNEELRLIGDFVAIYRILMQGELDYGIEVDPAVSDVKIPCLILQPLVENAVLHGLRTQEGGGSLYLSMKTEGDDLRIQLTDDGRGMPPEVVLELNEGLNKLRVGEALNTSALGTGLRNVLQRLHWFYEGEASLTVLSAADSGTVLDLSFPLNHPSLEEMDLVRDIDIERDNGDLKRFDETLEQEEDDASDTDSLDR